MKITKLSALCLSAFVAIGTAQAADPVSEKDKTLYALGVAVSQSLADFGLTEAELDQIRSGITDGVMKKPLKVDMQTYGPKIQPFAEARTSGGADKEKAAGNAFLAKAAAEAGVKKTASGAIVKTIKEGTGASPTAADTVKVHYHGTLTDGTVFDSSVKRGEPATFPLGGVIKCWTEGVQMMKVGGKARLVCPAAIAYGDRGAPPAIKPGATLVFEVDLLEIVKK
jgi:FKBP-type peptidyl-prolyl cis-trans isomerase FkpA/FKBP-type peptidyl-prolyl cis-trans isomerase FklB